MLQKTFVHIPGIGLDTERSLWRQGCSSWECLLSNPECYSVGSADRARVVSYLKRSINSLQQGKHQFFRKALGKREAWRAYEAFRHSCVYLDIETDGSMRSNSITTIGLYDGKRFQCLTKGEDLGNFPDIISHYSMIVSFAGMGFDVPMLQKAFPLIQLDQIHIDLCPTLRRLGLRGGLKRIEKELGIQRSPETAGMDGLDAVRLWRRYTVLREESALEKLVAYNREDCVNLEKLAEYAFRELSAQVLDDAHGEDRELARVL